MPLTWTGIYLGTLGFELDPTEGDALSDDAGLIVGETYGSAGDPLRNHLLSFTAIDNGGAGGVLDIDNTASNDQVSYDLGSGPVTAIVDAAAVYDATVTYIDGSTGSVTAVLFQDEFGNLFLAPELSDNADTTVYEAAPIRSLTLDALSTDFTNLSADRVETNFLCLAGGTRILTPSGERPVEELRQGDEIISLDTGRRYVRMLVETPPGDPGERGVLIRAGALGPGRPHRDLVVSRHHRVLVAAPLVQRMFGTPEVLVSAFRLIGLPGIGPAPDRDEGRGFYNILLGRHEVIFANGAPVESLLPGPMTQDVVRDDIWLTFLARRRVGQACRFESRPARPIPKVGQQRGLADRLARNGIRPLDGWSHVAADIYAMFI